MDNDLCPSCRMPGYECLCGKVADNVIIKSSNNIVDRAEETMKLAHMGQKRWDGSPYEEHPRRVVDILKNWGIVDEDMLAAGFLHDVLEDNRDFTKEILKNSFNERITDMVVDLTIRDKRKYFDQIKAMSDDAKLIKFADLLANITDMKGAEEDPIRTKRTMRKWVRAIRIVANTVQKRLEDEIFR